MSTENVETLKDFLISLWIPEKKEAALAMLTPDFVAYEAAGLPYGGEYEGAVGFERLLENVLSVVDLEILNTTYRDAGDVVVADMDVRLTSRKTSQVLNTRIVELYAIADGRISTCDVFYKDTKAVVDLDSASAQAS